MNKNLKYQYYLLIIPGTFPFVMYASVLNYKKYLKKYKLRSIFKVGLNSLITWFVFLILPDIIYSGSLDYILNNAILFPIYLYFMNFTVGLYSIREEKRVLEKYS